MSQTFIAKTISGLEEVLAAEIAQLGANNVQLLKRAVSFEGDLRMLYTANYCLRTAQRILMPLFSFELDNEDDLYRHIYEYRWEDQFSLQKTFAIDAVVSDSELTHSHFVALRTKDAIADRFRMVSNGRRPSVDVDNPHIRINIHINGSACDVSLDSSGASLHKRGYRVSNAEAPMSEVLAAGLIQLSGWKRDSHFIDPMCGSGTLLIEAAMYANNFPAGMYRKEFGFMHWPGFDQNLWNEVMSDALDKQTEFEYQIVGSDISSHNLAAARANLKSARLHKDVKVFVSPITAIQAPRGNPGIIVINPPYGERIRLNDIIGLYRSIGDVLKQEFSGYQAWVISSDQKALSFIGLKPSKKLTVYNGQLECRFVNYDLYKGSKRGRYISEEASKTDDSGSGSQKSMEKGWETRHPAPEYKSEFKSKETVPHRHKNLPERQGAEPNKSRAKFGGAGHPKIEKSELRSKESDRKQEKHGQPEPFWKQFASNDRPEKKEKDPLNEEPTFKPRHDAGINKVPSEGSRFSSFKDYEVKREKKLRPRKQKRQTGHRKPPAKPDNLDD